MKETKSIDVLNGLTSIIPLIPTIDVVVFPQMVVPLLVVDEKIIRGIIKAAEGDKYVALVATKKSPTEDQASIHAQDLFSIGMIARIMRVVDLPDGGIKVLAQGVVRCQVDEVFIGDELLTAQIKAHPFTYPELHATEMINLKMQEVLSLCEKLAISSGGLMQDFHSIFSQVEDPERAIDFLLSHLTLTVEKSQKLLESENILDVFEKLRHYLHEEIESSKVQETIRINARDAMNKSQKEYYLREQMRAIQRELGDDQDNELDELRKKLAAKSLSEEAQAEANRQLKRLERTSPDSLESTVIKSHLEWICSLPWGTFTTDNLALDHAKKVLDTDHYGLEKIKDRILDFLSVKNFQRGSSSPILCFAGAPGVGKTSLGRSIARCLGRNFFRIALGGVHDESELRGHRRTYVGALPGRIIQALAKTGSSNPVILIDEIDKVGSSGRGDPAAALLEILDSQQNNAFYDNYLGVPFDLSSEMFITTANDLSAMPSPLRDRLEIIEVAGYSSEEKVHIASKYLIPRAIEAAGLSGQGFELSDDILKEIIVSYTRESGVRSLDRYVQKLCSKFARSLVEGSQKARFTSETIPLFLGPRKILFDKKFHVPRVGVTNGLAWTPYGGELLQVEAVLMPGAGKLLLTGQLGEVMRESAQTAVSYIRSRAAKFKVDKSVFTDSDLHIHLPAGGVPKDGPSAGITLLASILSVLTARPIDGGYAMTGEVDLQGTVLPIGGLKEKILAAKQHGIEKIIIPMENKKDIEEFKDILEGLSLFFVDRVEQVIDHVLLPSETTL